MEVAAYIPYRQHAFQPECNPHYAQFHESRAQTSQPVSDAAMTSQYHGGNVSRTTTHTTPSTSAAVAASQVSDDANRPSLPSISNLLGIADGDRASLATQETCSPSQQQQQQQQAQQQVQQQAQQQQAQQSFFTSTTTEPAFNQGFMTVAEPVVSQRGPSSPPLRSDSVVETAHSPSTVSHSSLPNQSYFMGSSVNNLEPYQQRSLAMKRHSVPMPAGAAYTTFPYSMAGYNSSPSGMSASSYYSADSLFGMNNVYSQRPLPSNFPPVMATPVAAAPQVSAPVWEHHHYIGPSSQASYPQSTDRYVCQTCSKAFSRPSSLRIHSYSHTGEKPYKCSQPGCGKAFSVRSNMKRHERGCHLPASKMVT